MIGILSNHQMPYLNLANRRENHAHYYWQAPFNNPSTASHTTPAACRGQGYAEIDPPHCWAHLVCYREWVLSSRVQQEDGKFVLC
jgi:hypothetical protein